MWYYQKQELPNSQNHKVIKNSTIHGKFTLNILSWCLCDETEGKTESTIIFVKLEKFVLC